MEAHFHLDDNTFERQFATCTLDPAIFTHEAHLRLAWIHIRKYGTAQAIENIYTQLTAFMSSVGATGKYHKTLTIAAIHAVHHFMGKAEIDNFHAFIRRYPRLKSQFREIIGTHYSTEVLASARTTTEYVEPDLQPFPEP